MLVAEDLALLAIGLDGEPARAGTILPAVSMGIAGALVHQLEQDGHVTLDDDLRIRTTGSQPRHELLVAELDVLRRHDGQRLGTCLAGVRHIGWDEVVDHLAATGVVAHEKKFLRRARYRMTDPRAHADLIGQTRHAALRGEPWDERTVALLAFAAPSQLSEVLGGRAALDTAAAQIPLAGLVEDAVAANRRHRLSIVDGA
jgi:hypothetical protein